MSWNNALPWWVYAVEYEQYLAECSCCTWQEWYSGTSKELPNYVHDIRNHTFEDDKDAIVSRYDSLVYPDPSGD